MPRTILICGHGPGISNAVARRFGAEGFRVGLVARSRDKLEAAAKSLGDAGITAAVFPTDLADPAAVTRMVADARAALGPITALHWNAYGGDAGDLTDADLGELRRAFDLSTTGFVAAVQAALPDLRTQPDPAVLVTGGGLSFYDPKIDAMAVSWNAAGLAVAKAAQHKAVGVLHQRLARENIYVGEVVVLAPVKGTAFDRGNAVLEAATIADRFWSLYRGRTEATVSIGA